MHFYKLVLLVVGDKVKYQVSFLLRDEEIPMMVDDLRMFKGVIEIAEEFNYLILDAIEIDDGVYEDAVELDKLFEIVDYTKNPKTKKYNRFYIRTGLAGDTFEDAEEVYEVSKNGEKFKYDDRFDHILCDLNLNEIFKYVENNFIEIV